jgi:hypothetical protein
VGVLDLLPAEGDDFLIEGWDLLVGVLDLLLGDLVEF